MSLCLPMDYTVHGILQARILEWVAVPFSRGSSQPRDQAQVSHISGSFFTSWATREAPKRVRDQREVSKTSAMSDVIQTAPLIRRWAGYNRGVNEGGVSGKASWGEIPSWVWKGEKLARWPGLQDEGWSEGRGAGRSVFQTEDVWDPG